jgi:hypothetical protein
MFQEAIKYVVLSIKKIHLVFTFTSTIITVSDVKDILYTMRLLKECRTEEWFDMFLKKNDDIYKVTTILEEFPEFDNVKLLDHLIELLETPMFKGNISSVLEYMRDSNYEEGKKRLTEYYISTKPSIMYMLQFVSCSEGTIDYPGVKEYMESVKSTLQIQQFIVSSHMKPHWMVALEDIYRWWVSTNPTKEDLQDVLDGSSRFENWYNRYIKEKK